MSSLRTLEYCDVRGFYFTLSPSGRVHIDRVLPEDVYTLDDDPTEAGETGPEWPAEGGVLVEPEDCFLDDPGLMGRAA